MIALGIMRVHTMNNTKLNANYYHFCQLDGEGIIDKIYTDNSENLGAEPILITNNENIPMTCDGKYYSASVKSQISEYKIYYKDTGLYENGGNPIKLNKHKISRDIYIKDLINTGKPLQKNIAKGFAEGKIVCDTNNIPSDEAVILVLGDVGEGSELIELPPNVLAVVVSDGKIDYLSHIAALSRSYFNLFTVLYDENKYEELLGYEGQYINISNLEGDLRYVKIDKPTSYTENYKIIIPKFTKESDFLDYENLNSTNSGTKALRIAAMQSLIKNNVLKDVIIPSGFVVSTGYIENIESFLNEARTEDEREEKLINNPFSQELLNKCNEVGINPQSSIIRSAFNAEDLCDYPTAGLYESECCHFEDEFIYIIDSIYRSKDKPSTIESRKRYNIPDEIVQPSVLIQEYIPAKYKFTAYTDLSANQVLIELGASEYAHLNIEPAKIIYNNEKQSCTIKDYQIYNNKFLIDEQCNIIEKECGHNPVADGWEQIAPLLKTVGINSLILEKVFAKPQDIEGGIIDGKVYFWQTRDIVKKALKRL